MPSPLDELPIHQVPLSMRHPATSDRNFYDRCYLNAHDRSGEVFLISGLGVYPNLGVIDAYATVRAGDRQVTVRASDALGDDRSIQQVGPYRIEVLEPLERLRVVCEAPVQGVQFDLEWHGSFPAVEEQPHQWRQGPRVILDACRFAQVGTWAGTLVADGTEWTVDHDTWVGTRDRSWGIRPVGEAEPAGRTAAEMPADYGFWWLYVPLRFDDFALVLIAQEDGHGHRILNDAVRVWPHRVEQLGWPTVDVHYTSGTRIPTGATIHAVAENGTPLVVEVESLGFVALHGGSGYGGDPEWNHGMWKGRAWVDRAEFDYTSDDAKARLPWGMLDHVGRATVDGAVGYGLFEHMSIGRHDPSGFVDMGSVAR